MFLKATRHPVFDVNKSVVFTEVVLDEPKKNVFGLVLKDPSFDNCSALINNLNEFCRDSIAAISFNKSELARKLPTFVTPDTLIVGINEEELPGKTLLNEVKSLKSKGYTILLDNYHHHTVWKHFYPFIDFIKFSAATVNNEEVREIKDATSEHSNVKLVISHVNNHDEFKQWADLGVSLFQGQFIAKPLKKDNNVASLSQFSLSELLYESSAIELNFQRIANIIEKDVKLSYTFLAYASKYREDGDYSTILQALSTIGVEEIKKFISYVFVMQACADKPPILMKLSLIRAKFLNELCIKHRKVKDPSLAFLTGMLSLLDALLDDDIANILADLQLTPAIKNALIFKKGYLAYYLVLAKAIESANWSLVDKLSKEFGIGKPEILALYNEASLWADEQQNEQEPL